MHYGIIQQQVSTAFSPNANLTRQYFPRVMRIYDPIVPTGITLGYNIISEIRRVIMRHEFVWCLYWWFWLELQYTFRNYLLNYSFINVFYCVMNFVLYLLACIVLFDILRQITLVDLVPKLGKFILHKHTHIDTQDPSKTLVLINKYWDRTRNRQLRRQGRY